MQWTAAALRSLGNASGRAATERRGRSTGDTTAAPASVRGWHSACESVDASMRRCVDASTRQRPRASAGGRYRVKQEDCMQPTPCEARGPPRGSRWCGPRTMNSGFPAAGARRRPAASTRGTPEGAVAAIALGSPPTAGLPRGVARPVDYRNGTSGLRSTTRWFRASGCGARATRTGPVPEAR